MNIVDELVRSIFQKESLNDCSVEDLQTIAAQYSYFTPVQFLLAEKLRPANESLYKEKLQTLSLHFNNPLWLDLLLNGYQTDKEYQKETQINSEQIAEPAKEEVNETLYENVNVPAAETNTGGEQDHIESPVEETYIESEIAEPINEESNESQDESLNISATEVETEAKQDHIESFVEESHTESEIAESINEESNESPDENQNVPVVEVNTEEKQDYIESFVEESHIESEIAESINREVNETLNENVNVPAVETNITEEKHDHIESFVEESHTESEIAESINKEVNETLNENVNVPAVETNITEEKHDHIESSVGEAHLESEVTEPVNEEVNELLSENAVIAEEKEENIETSTEEAGIETESEASLEINEENNESPFPIHLPDLNQEPTETELSFEPYHTVDYFASQGIKFIPEEKPADRFGQQLKSFTEWLKSMKRLPETESIKLPDLPTEEKVLQLADHSLNQGEVVTETMAEVWLKQGNKEKAIEIYNKLSLLNPPKSAYFASLAERLKNS